VAEQRTHKPLVGGSNPPPGTNFNSSRMGTPLHQTVLKILKSHTITDQHQLLDLLCKKGINVSQPSLSRVLKSLGIVKCLGRYSAPAEPREMPSGKTVVIVIEPNMLVVHTELGMATALAARLDACIAIRDPANFTRAPFSEVLRGTLAGDDTIFLVFKESTSLKTMATEVENFFANPPMRSASKKRVI
jgi:arginine repressor